LPDFTQAQKKTPVSSFQFPVSSFQTPDRLFEIEPLVIHHKIQISDRKRAKRENTDTHRHTEKHRENGSEDDDDDDRSIDRSIELLLLLRIDRALDRAPSAAAARLLLAMPPADFSSEAAIRDALGSRALGVDPTIVDYIVDVLKDETFDFGRNGAGAFEALGELLVGSGCVDSAEEAQEVGSFGTSLSLSLSLPSSPLRGLKMCGVLDLLNRFDRTVSLLPVSEASLRRMQEYNIEIDVYGDMVFSVFLFTRGLLNESWGMDSFRCFLNCTSTFGMKACCSEF
jgi:hypothetical protein